MKNTLKFYLFSIFMTTSFFLFNSCSVEESTVTKETFRVRYVSLPDLARTNPQLNQAYSKVKELQANPSARLVYDSRTGLLIDDEKGLLIENDTMRSITFRVISLDEEEKIKNLIFNQKDNGDFDVYVMKFDIKTNELSTLSEVEKSQRERRIAPVVVNNQTSNNYQVEFFCSPIYTDIEIEVEVPNAQGSVPNAENLGSLGSFMTTTISVITGIDCIGAPDTGFTGWGGVANTGGGGFVAGGGSNGNSNGSSNGGFGSNSPNNPGSTAANPEMLTALLADTLDATNSIGAQLQFFLLELETQAEKDFFMSNQNLKNYLIFNGFSHSSRIFVKNLVYACLNYDTNHPNEINEVISILCYIDKNDYYNKPLDEEFFTNIDDASQLNFTDPNTVINFIRVFFAHCATIRHQNPSWSDEQIYGQALLDTTHLLLEVVGLVPAIGEVFDLANGIIYSIEGDTINATLSFSSMIPIGGWLANGAKLIIRSDGLKYFVMGANNLVTFGSANSARFRRVCGIAPGDATQQAHHLLPRASAIVKHPVVQRATQSTIGQGFHIDDAFNGLPVATWRNQPNHNDYNDLIEFKLDEFIDDLPEASPEACHSYLLNLTTQIKEWVIANPNKHLNELILP